MGPSRILTCACLDRDQIDALLQRYGITFVAVADGAVINGSYWGEPEAGIVGCALYARSDTPVHSLLHELAHIVCMTSDRRRGLVCDAGGDDLEEAAVCYLQVVLAEQFADLDPERLMRDMDAWGYSFRLGSAACWFRGDSADARDWLVEHGLLTPAGRLTFSLRA